MAGPATGVHEEDYGKQRSCAHSAPLFRLNKQKQIRSKYHGQNEPTLRAASNRPDNIQIRT